MSEQLSLKDLIPVGIAFAGYFAGTLHTAAANIRERRKALNAVLFSLLEMRWEIITSDPRLMMAAIRRLLVERFGGQAELELSKPDVRQFFSQLLSSLVSAERDGIGTRYSEAVQTLAPFYPIIAHRLAGEGIIRIDTRLREHYDRVRQHPIIAADPLVPASLALIEDRTLSQMFDEASKRLAADLKDIARQFGLLARLRIYRMIKDQDERVLSDAFYGSLKIALEPMLTGL
jgi:hypothetical protein